MTLVTDAKTLPESLPISNGTSVGLGNWYQRLDSLDSSLQVDVLLHHSESSESVVLLM